MEGKYILYYIVVLFVSNINADINRRIDPFVETKLGIIRGVRATDGEYSMFMGIPYAYVNESNPFGPATPHQGFNNVFEAYDDSAMCPQFEEMTNTIEGSLDCLHINVYVPNTASILNHRPVLVWIFGGGFNLGSAGRQIYGPKYLVRHDIVMDNIEAFSGDANKITIFGESAGAASVDLHLYNQEENLFKQMIMQSGSALSPWAVLEPDTSAPLILAEYLGFETNVLYYLDIDSEISVKQRPFHARNAFWDLFYKLNKKAQNVVLLALNINAESNRRIDPFVETKLGIIRGVRATDGEYSMFMGIPYAYVNESNPFGPATPHQGFNNVFEAYDDSAICPQFEEVNNTLAGTLDCLHINVYVPNTASILNRRPVLVWIFGGGFNTGSAGRQIYGPKYLVRHDVVMVTLNYRLGPYGFMCLDNPDVPGNEGLKDQRLALKWVKNNIEAFGGDANKITLFGESAGAASIDLHLYNQEENLFEQMIMQSGSALSPWAVLEPDTSAPLVLAKYLGLETSNENEALSYLSNDNVFRNFLNEFFDMETEQINKMAKVLRNFYIADERVTKNTISPLIDFNSDYTFNKPMVRSIPKYMEYGCKNIYHYIFSYDGERNFMKDKLLINEEEAAHADELSYQFDVSYMTEEPTPQDQIVIDRVTTLWTNFAKYGNPTPATSELLPVTWTPVSQDALFYLDIDSEISVKKRPFHERMAFWELFYKLNKKAQKGFENAETKENK
ncbi:Uncharacterized protein OBRU01_24312 [Operophtera brumata]|uniref:Carboxylesterase type B domain-containing protein n=1 Tax=Operophtera brumata TaxID=104452 RepID=A0A0L7KMN2_OPEBR|nr:Uncharacterized protein OBRU01_24312 [Operophtera brumata]